ncbi:GGDEF domain-containing protein [Caenispirillum bisanense]|uniref:diguanylate cyclase n=1 Tax=Caenispirillum bisanense TaxID=414052 RepID=A0A286G034_9PROT|nr:GGDEF domain-containing protein [Caenispirillum bisanense]SOD88881.1 diguanylate cyclase [Caenispirillum bisanense]
MQFAHTKERADALAAAALSRMATLAVAPTPNNYLLWYAYEADGLPDLRREVDRLLGDGTTFSPEVCEGLYQRHFTGQARRDGIDDASRKLEETIATVAYAVGTAEQGAADYGRTLQGLVERAGQPEQLNQTLASVLAETRRMAELNRALEQQLTDSRKEVSELRQNLTVMEEQASIDGLTGIANRRVFERILIESAAKAQTKGGFVSLLMIDIDHFKAFNDTHGHLLGDQVLKLVAKSMVDTVRPGDTAARYGGEEFAVILPSCTLTDARALADKIRLAVASRRIVNRRTNQDLGKVTLSIGVAEMALGEPLTGFVQRADEALYTAKRNGRNRVCTQAELERQIA